MTDKDGKTAKSSTVTLTLPGPVITAQPESVTAAAGTKATFTVAATGDTLTYQWYYKAPSAGTFSASSCKTATYSFTAQAAYNGRKIYCMVTDKNGNTAKSSTVTLTVT